MQNFITDYDREMDMKSCFPMYGEIKLDEEDPFDPPATDILSTMPDKVKAMIVGKMDLKSLLNFRATSILNHSVVNEHAKINIEIYVKYKAIGYMEITVKEENKTENAMIIEVKNTEEDNYTVYTTNQYHQLMHVRKIESSTMENACFRTVGRIIERSFFVTRLLHLALGPFRGNIDFGLKMGKVHKLAFFKCLNRSTVASLFSNYPCAYEIVEIDAFTRAVTGIDKKELVKNSVRRHHLDCIEVFEKFLGKAEQSAEFGYGGVRI